MASKSLVNNNIELLLIGATLGKGISEIKYLIAKEFGIPKNNIHQYDFYLKGLDVRKLKNENRLRNTILIIGSHDDKIKYLSESSSLKGAIQNNPQDYPKAKFALDCRKSLSPITLGNVRKLLREFKDEGTIN